MRAELFSVVRQGLAALWRRDRFLTGVALVMLVALVPMLIGLAVDPRTITGAPAWLKPAKFAASTAIYSLTLAWILGYLPSWRRVRWAASRVTGLVFIVEVAIIAAQAWRGTSSHFNLATPLDAALFQVMGTAIVLQTLVAFVVATAVWRQAFADRALGWAVRLGVTIAIAGAATGGLMTRLSDEQQRLARTGRPVTIAGAHTIGGQDGGPGLPGTGWSVEHGDLRVAHFVGLHAMQALPALALILRRRRVAGAARRTAMVIAGSASYVGLFAILLWQALRGQSIVALDPATVAALASWAAFTVVAMTVASGRFNRKARLRTAGCVSA